MASVGSRREGMVEDRIFVADAVEFVTSSKYPECKCGRVLLQVFNSLVKDLAMGTLSVSEIEQLDTGIRTLNKKENFVKLWESNTQAELKAMQSLKCLFATSLNLITPNIYPEVIKHRAYHGHVLRHAISLEDDRSSTTRKVVRTYTEDILYQVQLKIYWPVYLVSGRKAQKTIENMFRKHI